MSILRVGSSGKYSEGWDQAFGKKRQKPTTVKKKAAKKTPAKKAAAKPSKKKR